MDYSEKELEEKLRVAGERLAQLPTRVDVLLPLLDVSPSFSLSRLNLFSFYLFICMCLGAIEVFLCLYLYASV